MAAVEPDEETLKACRLSFPESLVGLWSTLDLMTCGRCVAFHDDGTGSLKVWSIFNEGSEEQTTPFRWRAKDGLEIEVMPLDKQQSNSAGDWGRFIVEFFLFDDVYRIKYLAIRDGNARCGRSPFWWFMDSDNDPMCRIKDAV
jgi:hypothetical protein